MPEIIDMRDAKVLLPRLVRCLESGQAQEFIIARNGRPAARLVPLHPVNTDRARRIGVAKGRFKVPDDIDRKGPKLAHSFGVLALAHCRLALDT